MAEVPVNINGVIVDLYGRTIMGPVKIVGSMSRTDVGVGGGPIIPPGNGDKPPQPPGWGIWGGGNEPFPTPPIYIPPMVPPGMKPPEAPEPGAPTTAVPGNWPVQPIAPPEYLIVNYPGIGPVVVAPPAEAQPKT